LRRAVQQLDVTDAVAEQMWIPALAALREKHAQWIDEDLEELEELIWSAETWRVNLPDDEPGVDSSGPPPPDHDPDPGDCVGDMPSTAAALGLAAVAVARSRQK
jgi:hypothetical protein